VQSIHGRECALASRVTKFRLERIWRYLFTSSIARAGTFAWIDMSSMTYQSHKRSIFFKKIKRWPKERKKIHHLRIKKHTGLGAKWK
jgi:hypothetical protein